MQTEDGRRASRDIVQFVAFKECRTQEELAAQVRLADCTMYLCVFMIMVCVRVLYVLCAAVRAHCAY
jgi:hypothetical protein